MRFLTRLLTIIKKRITINMMDDQLNCRYCGKSILASDYFCPNCGKKLKEKILSTTIGRQIFIYLLSFLLPPLGLWPAIKYLKQKDEKSRMIGFVAIGITIISLVITIWLSVNFMNTLNQEINKQLNGDWTI